MMVSITRNTASGPAIRRICTSAASGSAMYTSAMRMAGATRTSRTNSQTASSPTTIANDSNASGDANQTRATVRAMSTAPLMTRVTWSFHAESNWRRLDAAVPPVALLIGEDRFEQMAAAKVGPQRFGDPDLGIRDLPQQEIADAHLAARPDQQIRIGLSRGVEEFAELPLVQIVRADAGRDDASGGVDDLRAAAVVQRDVEQHPRVRFGLANADFELVAHVGRQLVAATDHLEPDVVLEERSELELQIALQQRHQRVDLGAGTFPVLDREG